MATKTISITEEAYGILASRKKENDSFSRVITREMGNVNQKLLDLAGSITKEEAEEWKKQIEKDRKSARWNQ